MALISLGPLFAAPQGQPPDTRCNKGRGGGADDDTSDGNSAEAVRRMNWYYDVFGQDGFFIELQQHDIKEITDLNRRLVEMGARYSAKYVATDDRPVKQGVPVLIAYGVGISVPEQRSFVRIPIIVQIRLREAQRAYAGSHRFHAYPGQQSGAAFRRRRIRGVECRQLIAAVAIWQFPGDVLYVAVVCGRKKELNVTTHDLQNPGLEGEHHLPG